MLSQPFLLWACLALKLHSRIADPDSEPINLLKISVPCDGYRIWVFMGVLSCDIMIILAFFGPRPLSSAQEQDALTALDKTTWSEAQPTMLDKRLEHFNWHEKASCPGKFHTECQSLNESANSMEMRSQVAYVSIVSSLFSCIASVLIVYSYVRWASSVVVCFENCLCPMHV